MTKDAALKLGLQLIATAEYLATDAEICGKDAKEERALIQRSKIAFEEALAQPEQERFLVATIGNWGRVQWADGVFPSIGDKMYSAPRTWVGLTVDELIELERKHGSHESLTRAIDDMLKGKNS